MMNPRIFIAAVIGAVALFSLGIAVGRIGQKSSAQQSTRHPQYAYVRHTPKTFVRRAPAATPKPTATPQPTVNPYPYVESKDQVDMWDSEDDMCNGFRQVAEAIVNAQQNGEDVNSSSVVNSLPGHSYLSNGTRVAVIDHTTWQCSDTTFDMTKVHTESDDYGYIMEGSLSKD